ncbi:hypothetical protein VTN49DRAFT_6330 [Thermomyces lanuginosus]|uniref:uncharacterized protein n=1 Tax=Thermomyces lanuginosus TaxID=5541 RepID=UPI0037430732
MPSLIPKHPLQKLPSPDRGVSAFVHLIGLSSFAYSWKFLFENEHLANDAYGWHFAFLTVIGLFLSTLTFVAGLVADITLSRRLFLVKNMLSVCSAPLEVLISVLYWGLRLYDKHLVIPEGHSISLEADLNFHLVPFVVMLIDLLFLSPPWTITAVPAMALSGCLAVAYWFWVEKCYQENGWYPYPIFELLDTKGRIGLFAVSALLMTANTLTLKHLYGRVNGFGRSERSEARPGDVKKGDYHRK